MKYTDKEVIEGLYRIKELLEVVDGIEFPRQIECLEIAIAKLEGRK